MPDKDIACADCGSSFVFTEREQEWYREKGLSHEPRRCKDCRSQRKSGEGGGGGHGGGSRGGHGGGYGGGDGGHRGPSRPKEMFETACATCGKTTEVPFRPDPSRPVYCRECFTARGKRR